MGFMDHFRPQQSQTASRLQGIRQLMGGNPQAFAERMMMSNPQFAQFVQANRDKTPQQIAQENGIDWATVQSLMR